MSQSPIYLDFSASTPVDRRVILAMEPYWEEFYHNPSALYQSARRVKNDLESARQQVAQTIGARAHNIIFTAGATESCNLAIKGVLGRYGGRVALPKIEHQAVLEVARLFEHDYIATDKTGLVSASAVEQAITDETTLLSVGYVNNEIGTVQPLRQIAEVIEKVRQKRLSTGNSRPLYLHTDASQAFGLLDCAISRLGVDLMTLNSGKCYGPKQVGVLWVHPAISLEPLIHGGGQESGLRSGTENVAGAIGCAVAFELAHKKRASEATRLTALRDKLQKQLTEKIPDLVVNGHSKRRAPHILHFSVAGLDGERAVLALDEKAVMVATGSACSANDGQRSHVLEAIGLSNTLADGSLRISLGRSTTDEQIDRASQLIAEVIEHERYR